MATTIDYSGRTAARTATAACELYSVQDTECESNRLERVSHDTALNYIYSAHGRYRLTHLPSGLSSHYDYS